MRHIQIYEAFQDEAGQSARDLFGLTSSFTRDYPVGMSVTFTGPSEEEAEARRITDKLGAVASEIVDALEEIGWQEECEYKILSTYSPLYSFKGSFRNWRQANSLIGNIKTSARYAAMERMKEDDEAGDEEKQEFYEESIHDSLANPEMIQKFKDIGYTIENKER